MKRASVVLLALFGGAAVVLAIAWRDQSSPPRLSVDRSQLLADGYDTATLKIEGGSGAAPRVSAQGATVEEVARVGDHWEARLRAGVLPGRIGVRVEFPHSPSAATELTAELNARDSAEDGTPDFLRLDDERDRLAFRRWFTYLAEAQYFQNPALRPVEIKDCAALIRYAYREALHVHDAAWTATLRLPVVPAFESPVKYRYPYTPLGPELFRVRAGPFRESDLKNGAFSQFADAQTLWRRNTHLVSRDIAAAAPGDLLFFRRDSGDEPFHSMIFLGASQIQSDARRYLIYHTGPDGDDPGEIRRPAVEELLRFPRPEWRPVSANTAFLGVYRWNILRKDLSPHDAAPE